MKRRPQLALPTGLIIDNFAGGGGASTGIELALGRSPDLAVNHDPEAVAMHEANHPATRHLCGDVWDVDPVRVCSGRPVALAWFSPDCKHHSKAKGGAVASLAARHDESIQDVLLRNNQDCSNAFLLEPINFYLPSGAKSPFPLAKGSELWVEVTVPPKGPPRPLNLALSNNGQWQPLSF